MVEVEKRRFGIQNLVEKLQLSTRANTLKAGGVALCAYDENYRLLRQKWHLAEKILSGDKMHELVDFTAREVIQDLEREVLTVFSRSRSSEYLFYRKMKVSPEGIDPGSTYLNAALNVVTAVMLNERLDFNHPQQVKVMEWIEVSKA